MLEVVQQIERVDIVGFDRQDLHAEIQGCPVVDSGVVLELAASERRSPYHPCRMMLSRSRRASTAAQSRQASSPGRMVSL